MTHCAGGAQYLEQLAKPIGPPPPGQDKRWVAGLVYSVAALAALVGAALMVVAVATAVGWLPAVEPLVNGPSAGNVATFTVAGATLLLADFTALLAWFTWESIGATRREAKIAEDALAAAKRQAE